MNKKSSIEEEILINNIKKKGFVFIHINKTAGTSITEVLNIRKTHQTAKEIIDVIGFSQWNKLYKFTVVRNPWDKVVSHFLHRIKMNHTNMGDGHISFNDWVKACYGPMKDMNYYDQPKMFQPQVAWLKDYNEEINIDKIIRFEDLQKGFEDIKPVLKIDRKIQLPHLNKNERRLYKDYYSEESIYIVNKWFKEDIKYFNYSFF